MKINTTSRSFRSFFTNNTALKIISLIFAIILWSFVTNSTNPERKKTIYNVPVVLQGLEALEEKGFTLRDDFDSSVHTIDVQVNVKYSDYRLVNKGVVFASIDVSEIERDGVNSVNVVPTFSNLVNVSLDSIDPQVINVTVDKILTKEVPVVVNHSGELADGLVMREPKYNKTVTVKGSSYYVERIHNAVLDVDRTLLKDGTVISSVCKFVDKDNNVIKFDGLRIDADFDVQTVKEVPINTSETAINTDKVKKGYQFVGLSSGKIKVCGHINDISQLTELTAAPIDLTGKDSSFTSAPLELLLPEGISVLDGQESPIAKVEIVQQKKTISIERSITVTGLKPGHTASLTSGDQTVRVENDGTANITASLTLTGSELLLQNVTETDVIVRLSLIDKDSGSYELTPVVILSSTLANNVTAQLTSPLMVTVSIS